MADQPAGEKSFEPTQKRKDDASKKGDVLRSKEVATAVSVLAGLAWFKWSGTWLLDGLQGSARASFQFDRAQIDDFVPAEMFANLLATLLPPVLTLGAIVIGITMFAQLLLGDGRFVMKNLQPKGSRLNPLSGLKRMLGTQGLIELGKSIAKLVLLAGLGWWWASAHIEAIFGLGQGSILAQLAEAWDALLTMLMALCAGLIIIAFIDWPIQFVRRISRLKMTHQEIRDENKQTEGSPELKAAQKQRQREMARGGVAGAMQDAQFIITNPTHFSVAMTYDPALAPAPVLLAKGRGDKALAMRDIAYERGLPVLEYPALARAVFFTTRENQVIREELYIAIASLLAFVMSLKRGEAPSRPRVAVPIELRFDANGQLVQA